jgi:hypothetical protein
MLIAVAVLELRRAAEVHPEGSAFARVAFYFNAPAVSLHQAIDKMQSHARALYVGVEAPKQQKWLGAQCSGVEAQAIVLHPQHRLARVKPQRHADPSRTGRVRIFEGVAEQVEYDGAQRGTGVRYDGLRFDIYRDTGLGGPHLRLEPL